MFYAGLSPDTIDRDVAEERLRDNKELTEFLEANGLGDCKRSIHVEERTPFEVISTAVEQLKPDVLIMGTNARSGITKALLGSVTEEALRSLDIDILAVPPPRQGGEAGASTHPRSFLKGWDWPSSNGK